MLRELTLDEIVEVTGGALIDGPQTVGISGEEAVTSVSTDTRSLQPGALFVALRGESFDGHAYVADAAKAGANALVVDKQQAGGGDAATTTLPPQIVVLDTLHALGDIARCVRDRFEGPVVGITGSVGKTTTKEMVAAVLEAGFAPLKSAANHNNEIGVPQTIFSLEPTHTALVLEMGMRGAGQILRLCEIGAPNIGIITNIGHSHIELLGSQEAIADAKGELFELLPEADGVAVYPSADPFAPTLRARFKGVTAYACGIDDIAATVNATGLARHEGGWRFMVTTPWGTTELFVPSPGRFNVQNALFAVAVGGHLGLELPAIAHALAAWQPPAMRMETIATDGGVLLLADAYNAAPDSMVAALETLHDVQTPLPTGKRIAVLGEMRELGTYAERGHQIVGRMAAIVKPDMLVLVGPLTRAIESAARVDGFPMEHIHYFATTDEAANLLPLIVQPGDVVLVKGSRALALERVVDALQGGISP